MKRTRPGPTALEPGKSKTSVKRAADLPVSTLLGALFKKASGALGTVASNTDFLMAVTRHRLKEHAQGRLDVEGFDVLIKRHATAFTAYRSTMDAFVRAETQKEAQKPADVDLSAPADPPAPAGPNPPGSESES